MATAPATTIKVCSASAPSFLLCLLTSFSGSVAVSILHKIAGERLSGPVPSRTSGAMFLSSNPPVCASRAAAEWRTHASNGPLNTTCFQTPSPGHRIIPVSDPSYFTISESNQGSFTPPSSKPSSIFSQHPASLAKVNPFRPNDMVLYQLLKQMGLTTQPPSQGLPGSNYRGQRQSPAMTREVQNLHPHQNCALFLTKIPVEVTLHEIFSVITTGAVFCLHINPPCGVHTTKAAKLAFMKPESAKAFLDKIQSYEGVKLRGKRIQGCYNRNGYARNENFWQSRVLELVGPKQLMVLDYWTSYLSTYSVFELESYQLMPTNIEDVSILQLRFARIDGQAQTCLQCIKHDSILDKHVQVRYGIDPCRSSTKQILAPLE